MPICTFGADANPKVVLIAQLVFQVRLAPYLDAKLDVVSDQAMFPKLLDASGEHRDVVLGRWKRF